ncbi:uncharacterized protein JCM15063_001657, partial [Sporobolomyces koalae]|uniref:uncharacterized protein n=1 Tax=Sporobolomyces koalae TaxID=500713 RepID=UPI00317E7DEB
MDSTALSEPPLEPGMADLTHSHDQNPTTAQQPDRSLASAEESVSTSPNTTSDSVQDPADPTAKPDLPPLAPLSTNPTPIEPATPRTRQLHFADTPLTRSYDPQASTSPQDATSSAANFVRPTLPSASSSRSTALGLYSTSTPATPHREL